MKQDNNHKKGKDYANLLDAMDDGVKRMSKYAKTQLDALKQLEIAISGKNNVIRTNAVTKALEILKSVDLEYCKSWVIVDKAQSKQIDIHSAPVKTHKLDIVNDGFGQHKVDQSFGKPFMKIEDLRELDV